MTSTPKSANQNGVSHREEFQIGWERDFSVPPYGGKGIEGAADIVRLRGLLMQPV